MFIFYFLENDTGIKHRLFFACLILSDLILHNWSSHYYDCLPENPTIALHGILKRKPRNKSGGNEGTLFSTTIFNICLSLSLTPYYSKESRNFFFNISIYLRVSAYLPLPVCPSACLSACLTICMSASHSLSSPPFPTPEWATVQSIASQ